MNHAFMLSCLKLPTMSSRREAGFSGVCKIDDQVDSPIPMNYNPCMLPVKLVPT